MIYLSPIPEIILPLVVLPLRPKDTALIVGNNLYFCFDFLGVVNPLLPKPPPPPPPLIGGNEYLYVMFRLGEIDGLIDGDMLGDILGLILGLILGDIDGLIEGDILGETLGFIEGLIDGEGILLIDGLIIDTFGDAKLIDLDILTLGEYDGTRDILLDIVDDGNILKL